MLVEPFFVWVLWNTHSHLDLLLWLGGANLMHLLQLAIWLNHRNEPRPILQCRGWSRHFFIFSLVTGMMWGFATLFFFPLELPTQVLLVGLLLGVAAVSTTMDATVPTLLYVYIPSLMLPLIFRVMVEQDETHIALGVMLLLFLVVMLGSGVFLGSSSCCRCSSVSRTRDWRSNWPR